MNEQILKEKLSLIDNFGLASRIEFDMKMKSPKPLKSMATVLNEVYQSLDSNSIKIGFETRLMYMSAYNNVKVYDQPDRYEAHYITEDRRDISSSFDNLVDVYCDSHVVDYVNRNAAIFRREWSPLTENNVIKGNLDLRLEQFNFENQILAYFVTPLFSLIGKPENGTSRLIELKPKGNAIKPGDEYVFWYHALVIPKNDTNRMFSTSVKLRLSFSLLPNGCTGMNISVDEVERILEEDRSEPALEKVENLDYEEPEYDHER